MSKRTIKTLDRIRRELSTIYFELKTDQIEPDKASKLTYILTQLAPIIRDSILEDRIKVIENITKKDNDYDNPRIIDLNSELKKIREDIKNLDKKDKETYNEYKERRQS